MTVYQAKVKCISLFLHGMLGWRTVGILSRSCLGSGRLASSVSVSTALGGVVVSLPSSLKGTEEPITVVAVELEGTGWWPLADSCVGAGW